MTDINAESIQVLDKGYVKLIETWGSDEGIIESARMSTQKGFEGWGPKHAPECKSRFENAPGGSYLEERRRLCDCTPKPGDEKLLRYLWENKHSTPFEFAGLTIEVRAPILVYREWHRHRTQSYSEASARYTPLPSDDYLPTVERLLMKGPSRQGASVDGAPELTLDGALAWLAQLAELYEHCENVYQDGLRAGVPKEIARLALTVGRYSTMRATTDLRNWLGFCTLRMAPNAQWEIREYANVVGNLIEAKFPRTWELFAEGLTG